MTIEEVGIFLDSTWILFPKILFAGSMFKSCLYCCLVPVNLKEQDAFHLTIEEYLLSLISMVEELVGSSSVLPSYWIILIIFFPSPVLLSTPLHWVTMSVLCRLAILSRISSLGFSYWIWRMTFCVRGVMGLSTVCVTLRFPKWCKIEETDYSVLAYRWRKSRTSCTTCPWETWSQRILKGLLDETGACNGILNSRFSHLKDIAKITDYTRRGASGKKERLGK